MANYIDGHDNWRLPIRPPRPEPRRRRSENKLMLKESSETMAVVPMKVRVEVVGGSHTTGSALRAQRVQRAIEETGGVATITEVASDRSELVAEVDGTQANSLARDPFVRKIVSLS